MKDRYERPWTRAEWVEFALTLLGALVVCIVLALFFPGCVVPVPPPHPPQPSPRTTQVRARFVTADGQVSQFDPELLELQFDEGLPSLPCVYDANTGTVACELPPGTPIPFGAHLDAQFPTFVPVTIDVTLKIAPDFATWQLVPGPNAAPDIGNPRPTVLVPVDAHVDPSGVPLDQLARIRGAMWTEQQPCPLGPRPNDPTNICATDFLWNYSDEWRERIVTNLTSLGYTHAVNGPLVDSDGYHGAWTPNDWTQRFDQFLDMLQYEWDHGLAPVVFITPDNWSLDRAQAELTPLLQQPRAQKLIRIAVRAWEPCKYECSSYTWAAYGQWLRQTLPNALVLLHTVCDVDAPVGTDSRGDDNGRPNAEGWARVAPFYHGWLTQSCTFQNPDGHDDPPFSNFENWTRLFNPNVRGSYADRFQHGYAGWPRSSAWGVGQPLKVYAGEDFSYAVFWQGKSKEEARKWGDAAVKAGADGYLDGGTLPVGEGRVAWAR